MKKLIRPTLYFCKKGVNDARWIIQRMRVIPEVLRQEVTDHYEKLVKPNDGYSGRKAANEYLKEVSDKYKPEVEGREIKLKKPPVKVKPGKREIISKCGLWSKDI